MNRYWMRIALGAVGIFVVGMLLVTGVRRGKAEVSKRIGGIALASAMMPQKLGTMTLDGDRIGTVTRLRIARDSVGTRRMDLTLTPSGRAGADHLASCGALAGDLEHLLGDESGGFRCAGADTAGQARFGTVAVASGDVVRPLFASAAQVARFEREDRNDEAQTVDVRADSATGQAHVLVQGADGRNLVRIDADSQNGALIDIRDEHGKSVFHLKADSTGLEMNAGGKKATVRGNVR
jgi:hypothetical protein